jgi:hypothetical protein
MRHLINLSYARDVNREYKRKGKRPPSSDDESHEEADREDYDPSHRLVIQDSRVTSPSAVGNAEAFCRETLEKTSAR